jgi:hypothetical protein
MIWAPEAPRWTTSLDNPGGNVVVVVVVIAETVS